MILSDNIETQIKVFHYSKKVEFNFYSRFHEDVEFEISLIELGKFCQADIVGVRQK